MLEKIFKKRIFPENRHNSPPLREPSKPPMEPTTPVAQTTRPTMPPAPKKIRRPAPQQQDVPAYARNARRVLTFPAPAAPSI
jgi:hypothetical protein